MAVADQPTPAQRDWKGRDTLRSALLQIAVVAVLLAGAVYLVVQRGERRKEVADRLKEARLLALRDNPRDLQRASEELTAIFAIDEDARDALALAADIETERWLFHRVQGAEEKARDYLRRAEAEESRSEERFGNRILHLLAEGKAEDAERYAEDLRRQGASSAKLWYGIAQAHLLQGRAALSREAFVQATDKAWKNARYFAAYGEAMLDQGDYRQAVEVLSRALTANPDHLRARLALALARIHRQERVKDAADAIKEALGQREQLTPGLLARTLAAQAELATFERRYDDAIGLAQQALQHNPQERFALLARARALALKKDPGALEAFRAAAAASRFAPAPYLSGAPLLQQAGNLDAALKLLDDYAQVYSKVEVPDSEGKSHPALERDDQYWIVRGDVFRAAGKGEEAMQCYEKAIAADGVNRTRAYFSKGALLLDSRSYDQALDALIRVTPDDGSGSIAEAYQAKGEALFGKREFAQGCQSYALALTRLRIQQVPRERLNALIAEVSRQLDANGQAPMAKLWEREANALIR
ncbi:MAG TPA: tetratricopeptide repeat protein [Myxococcaceae bacterium]|nr:tetratricopeptide repeat protein [Myxococcaceae bacterium]